MIQCIKVVRNKRAKSDASASIGIKFSEVGDVEVMCILLIGMLQEVGTIHTYVGT